MCTLEGDKSGLGRQYSCLNRSFDLIFVINVVGNNQKFFFKYSFRRRWKQLFSKTTLT